MLSTPIKSAIWIASLVAALIAIAANFIPPPQPLASTLAQIYQNLSSSPNVPSNAMASVSATAAANAARNLMSRKVIKSVYAVETGEGQGAVVRRSIGSMSLRNLSPFLMLDHFTIGEGAGFPDHPHRGMTTVTYMLQGEVEHEDFAGHHGVVRGGDLQWMSAAKGIMHAEMRRDRDAAGNKLPDPVGLQLWIDLPAKAKKGEPTYQEHPASEVPLATPRPDEPKETEGHGWEIKVISGESHGKQSPIRTPENGAVWYLDVHLKGHGARVFQEIPAGFTSFIYNFGKASIKVGANATEYKPYHTLVLSNEAQVSDVSSNTPQENGVWVEHAGKEGEEARLVIISGQPLAQEIHQYGPFVLESREAVQQTLRDFQLGMNGFERAPGWKSSIGGM